MTIMMPRFMTALTIAGLTAVAATPAGADLLFYAKNNCNDRVIFRVSSNRAASENCQSDRSACRGRNDEARSMRVTGNTRPFDVRVYDDPDGRTSDDYTVIEFRPYRPGYRDICIGSFEKSGIQLLPGDQGQISWKRKNGLDGKVSHIKVRPAQ